MNTIIKLTFPEFITHIPLNKKTWVKIGYNKLYSSSHYITRNALVAAMHKYIAKNIPNNLDIKTPIETKLIIYAPVNYGNVKRLVDKKTRKAYINWKPARPEYVPNWDLGNLASVWIKCLDDVLQKKGILPDDTIEFLKKTSYEFVEVATLSERKLIYELKTIENND